MKTIIYGNGRRVHEIATERGAVPQRRVYGDGQVVTSIVTRFEGGHDDFAGTQAWAEIPGDVPGTVSRFSPAPGRWMTGVRV